MDTKKKKKLKRFIKELENIRGRHTELISVYVPSGYEIIKIIQHLQQEQGTAENIKDKTTRLHVIDSLERAVRHLRLYKKTPENGLAVFAGNIAAQEGKTDLKVWSMEPPEPITTRLYRCDQTFVLDILKQQLEVKDFYGLIVMDNREATIGLLKGTAIIELNNMTSGVPGKIKAGGQCVIPETLTMTNEGDLIEIKNLHNPYIIKSANFSNYSVRNSNVLDKWNVQKNVAFKIITKEPRVEIICSKDHNFFIFDKGLRERYAENLKIGDKLLMPEKINVRGKLHYINSKKYYWKNKPKYANFSIKLPNRLDKVLAKFLGYICGDGNLENERVVLSEGNKNLALYYNKEMSKYFKTNSSIKYRKDKNYYEVKVYGKPIVNLIKGEFSDLKIKENSKINSKILTSKDEVLAGFIKGIFDAEGYVDKDEVAIGMNNRLLINQLQIALLRLGIIASFCEYDNRKNPYSKKHRFTLRITDKESLINFRDKINFTLNNKKIDLNKLVKGRTKKSLVRQILINGSAIRKIIEEHGYKIKDFPKVTNFFRDEREMSKHIFNNSILKEIKSKNIKLYNKLKKYLQIQLIPVKIKKIEILPYNGEMVDISVKNQNFMANGLIVHNSQQRFARLREGAAHEFYKRIGEYSNEQFYNKSEIKGIILGGPGPTKETFFKGDYLNNEVKKKILGLKDLSYTSEFGLHELVEKSHDLLAQEAIIEEKNLLNKFFTMLAKEPEKTTYGKLQTKKALEYGAVDLLLLSEDLDDQTTDEFMEIAEKFNTKVEIISIDTKEGFQLKELGGIASILRFALNQ